MISVMPASVTCFLCSGICRMFSLCIRQKAGFSLFRQQSCAFFEQVTVTCFLCSGNSHVFSVFRQQSRVFFVQATVTCFLCSGNSHVFSVFRQQSHVFCVQATVTGFCVQATVTCFLCSGNSHVFAGVLSFVPDGREYFWPSKEGNITTFFICFLFILHTS